MSPVLLDTCALIWLVHGDAISASARNELEAMTSEGQTTFISPISAWEVGMLVKRGRLQLSISPQNWFSRALAAPGVELAAMTPELLIDSSFLPGKPPSDPADRIIAATARDLGAMLITRDRKLLDYGEQGHMKILEC